MSVHDSHLVLTSKILIPKIIILGSDSSKSNSELALEERLNGVEEDTFELIRKPNFEEVREYLQENPNSFGYLPIFSNRTGHITRALLNLGGIPTLSPITKLGTHHFNLEYGIFDNLGDSTSSTSSTLIVHPETLKQSKKAGVMKKLEGLYKIDNIIETNVSTQGIDEIENRTNQTIVTIVSTRGRNYEPRYKFEELAIDGEGAITNFKFYRYGLRNSTELERISIRKFQKN